LPKLQRAGKLLEILLRRDNDLVPLFCRALAETDQEHIARMLGYKGLHTFVTLFISSPCVKRQGFVCFTCVNGDEVLLLWQTRR